MSRQGPCANNRVTGCQGIVSQRGHIFCDACNEIRKNMTKSRRDQDIEDLVNKNAELENEIIRLRQLNHETTVKYEDILKNSDTASLKNEHDKNMSEKQTQIDLLEMTKKVIEENQAKTITENKSLQKINQDLENDNKKQQEVNANLEKMILELRKASDDNSKYTLYNTHLEKENSKLSEMLSKLRSDNQNLVKERETYEMTHSQLKIDSQKILIDNTRLKESNARLLTQNEELVKENSMLSKINQELSEQNTPAKPHQKVVPKKGK